MHLTGLLDFPTSGLLYFTNSDTPSFVSMFSVSSFRLLSPSIVISPPLRWGREPREARGWGYIKSPENSTLLMSSSWS